MDNKFRSEDSTFVTSNSLWSDLCRLAISNKWALRWCICVLLPNCWSYSLLEYLAVELYLFIFSPYGSPTPLNWSSFMLTPKSILILDDIFKFKVSYQWHGTYYNWDFLSNKRYYWSLEVEFFIAYIKNSWQGWFDFHLLPEKQRAGWKKFQKYISGRVLLLGTIK